MKKFLEDKNLDKKVSENLLDDKFIKKNSNNNFSWNNVISKFIDGIYNKINRSFTWWR